LPLHIVQRAHNQATCFFDDQNLIEAMSGQRRELRKRGRPRTQQEHQPMTDPRQSGLPL
jgi:hypothetical protein